MKTEFGYDAKGAAMDLPCGQFVAFEVQTQTYLIPIDRVVEFRTWHEPTRVPRSPDYVLGIVNIRGEIVPVYDVAARLGCGTTAPSPRHVVVIVKGNDARSVGLLVDTVTDILSARPDDMATMPKFDGSSSTPFMSSAVFIEDRIVSVTDIEKLIEETFLAGVDPSLASKDTVA